MCIYTNDSSEYLFCVTFSIEKQKKLFQHWKFVFRKDILDLVSQIGEKRNVYYLFNPFWGFRRVLWICSHLTQSNIENLFFSTFIRWSEFLKEKKSDFTPNFQKRVDQALELDLWDLQVCGCELIKTLIRSDLQLPLKLVARKHSKVNLVKRLWTINPGSSTGSRYQILKIGINKRLSKSRPAFFNHHIQVLRKHLTKIAI